MLRAFPLQLLSDARGGEAVWGLCGIVLLAGVFGLAVGATGGLPNPAWVAAIVGAAALAEFGIRANGAAIASAAAYSSVSTPTDRVVARRAARRCEQHV